MRPSPSRRKEHGFTIGRGRSPSIEPDYDEDDDAWMDSIVEESKEFLADIPAVTSNETNQGADLSGEASGSNAGTTDTPQGDHRVTSSSSSGVELFSEASGSNAGTTDAPRGEASGSNADATGAPQGDQHSTMSTSTPMAVENIPPVRQRTTVGRSQQRRERRQEILESRAIAKENELLSLQSELSAARLHAAQLQQLLEEDFESHPSNKQARADRAELTKVRKELSKLRSTHAVANRELERTKDINDQRIVEYLALTRSVSDWKKNYDSLQKQLADKTPKV